MMKEEIRNKQKQMITIRSKTTKQNNTRHNNKTKQPPVTNIFFLSFPGLMVLMKLIAYFELASFILNLKEIFNVE